MKLPLSFTVWLLTTLVALGLFYFGIIRLAVFSGYFDKDRTWVMPYGEDNYIDTKSIWRRQSLYGTNFPCDISPGDITRNRRCDNQTAWEYLDVNLLIGTCENYKEANSTESICLGGRELDGHFIPTTQEDLIAFKARCEESGQPNYVYDICLAFHRTILEQLSYWPRVILPMKQISDPSIVETSRFANTSDPNHFLSEEGKRLDISPSIGSWVKEWNINNFSSMVNAYTGQLVLNKSFNSYFRDTFYSKDLVKEPSSMNEMAKYFGVSGVIINPKLDETEKFEKMSWGNIKLNVESFTYRQAPFSTNIYSLEQKPKILIIGSIKNNAYQRVFRLATQGAISYDKALLFEGKEKIDDYSLEELNKFNLLILHGFSYANRNKAYSLLEDYVNAGGKVLIETGWQYVSRDWGNEADTPLGFPNIIPVGSTTWDKTNFIDWKSANVDIKISENIEPKLFDDLIWQGGPWSLAKARQSDVKSWASPLLNVNGNVLIAGGNFGKGKIVWSGVNIFAHALDSDNSEEKKFIGNIIDYLLGENSGELANFDVGRDTDKLIVDLKSDVTTGTAFLFKENYYPYWKAYFLDINGTKTRLTIYFFGPRFMGVILPDLSRGSKIVFEFVPGLKILAPIIISICTCLLLIFFALDTVFFRGRVTSLFRGGIIKVANRYNFPFRNLKTWWKNEEG